MNQVKQIVDEIFGEIVTYRRELHKIPEIGFSEYKTADYICRQLDEMGIPYKRGIAKTGIVGFLKGNPGKKTLLMRADMDALPVTEENNCEFRSQHEGMMHACGHDAHMAILLGCAKVLSRLKDRLSCNIKFCFQPAEEAIGGALPMIEEGILENPHVDAAVGGHVMNDVPVGKVLVKAGEMMAAPDDFTLVVHGRGGHGAYPHECIDPIAIMTQILQGFNTLSARYTTPLEKHLISVNYFQAGTSYNVIPDDATVMGTVRVYNEDLRRKLPEEMEKIASSIAAAFGATCELEYIFRYPPLINDKDMTDAFRSCAEEILGKENVVEGKDPSMAGEDFAYFAKAVPSVFVNYGTGNEEMGATMPLHNAGFIIDEEGLRTGVLAMSYFALQFGR